MKSPKERREVVKKAYGDVAKERSSCCETVPTCCAGPGAASSHPVPEAEMGLSCGDPLAFAGLEKGDVVLDLGSGAGKDVFLAAQMVGPEGRVIGVDMTPDMVALARRNALKFRKATGLSNVEFRNGEIEHLPIQDASVDVVISNCVINLSPDKQKVFREVYRVLKPGGRMVVSDIVLNRELPARLKDSNELYAACVAGAMLREDYLKAIRAAGFEDVSILTDITYDTSCSCADPITREWGELLAGAAASITVVTRKSS